MTEPRDSTGRRKTRASAAWAGGVYGNATPPRSWLHPHARVGRRAVCPACRGPLPTQTVRSWHGWCRGCYAEWRALLREVLT